MRVAAWSSVGGLLRRAMLGVAAALCAACIRQHESSSADDLAFATHIEVAADGDVTFDERRHDLAALGLDTVRLALSEHSTRAAAGRLRLLDPSNPHGASTCDVPVRIEISPSARFDAFAWVIAEIERQHFARVELATSGGAPEPLRIVFDPSSGMNICGGARGDGPAKLRMDLGEFAAGREDGRGGEWSLSEAPDDERATSARQLSWGELVEIVRRRRTDGGSLVATVALSPDAPWAEVAGIVRNALELEPEFFSINPPRER